MSAPTNIDFTRGFDFTGAATLVPADLNVLVDSAVPYEEVTGDEGKGLIVCTRDAVLNTPSVPDAASVTKWKRYIWLRRPHSTATSTTPIIYVWNENAVSDITYLKWELSSDAAVLQAAIDAIETDIATLQSAQANQASQLNAVSGVANSAQADATEALAAIPAIESLTEAVTVTLPAADTTNAAAAAAAQVTASQAATNALAVASTTRFQSPTDYALAAGSVIANIAHGLGAVPKHFKWVLVCQAGGNANYVEGDEVDITCFEENSGNYQAFAFGCSTTNVFLIQSNQNTVRVLDKTNGVFSAITLASWKARCYAWKG